MEGGAQQQVEHPDELVRRARRLLREAERIDLNHIARSELLLGSAALSSFATAEYTANIWYTSRGRTESRW